MQEYLDVTSFVFGRNFTQRGFVLKNGTVQAFVLINVRAGKVDDVLGGVAALDHVLRADYVIGSYDIIALLEGPDPQAISSIVEGKMAKIGGLERTDTHFVMNRERSRASTPA